MSAMEKSRTLSVVARKRANKAASAAAEPVERRGEAEIVTDLPKHGPDAGSQEAVSQAQARIREAVIRNRQGKPDGASASHQHRRFASKSFSDLKKTRSTGRRR